VVCYIILIEIYIYSIS